MLSSLAALGATAHLEVLKKAIEIHTEELSSPPTEADPVAERTAEVFADSSVLTTLEDCDAAFFRAGDLSPLRVRYIRSHADSFIGN